MFSRWAFAASASATVQGVERRGFRHTSWGLLDDHGACGMGARRATTGSEGGYKTQLRRSMCGISARAMDDHTCGSEFCGGRVMDLSVLLLAGWCCIGLCIVCVMNAIGVRVRRWHR